MLVAAIGKKLLYQNLDLNTDEQLQNEAALLNQVGIAHFQRGEWQVAQAYFEQGLSLSRVTGDRVAEACSLENLAALCAYAPQRQTLALEYYQQVLAIRHKSGDKAGEATILFKLAGILQARSEYVEALALLERVVALDLELASPQLRSHRIVLGAVRKKLRRLAQES